MNPSEMMTAMADTLMPHMTSAEVAKMRQELRRAALKAREIERALDEIVADAMEEANRAAVVHVPPLAQVVDLSEFRRVQISQGWR